METLRPRVRLDGLLVERGLAATREQARALVLAGKVAVAGSTMVKPGQAVRTDAPLEVSAPRAYVSRGGIKLAHALDRFRVDPRDRMCADVGASTGGFTDCLIQRGARRVYAIDVGYGQLDWRLRTDLTVVVMERTNARYLERLPEPVDLVTIDASFISLRLLIPTAIRWLADGGQIVALIKPQFEAGRGRVGRRGVVRDVSVHREVLESFAAWIHDNGLHLGGLTASPIRGPAGNVEFLARVLPASARGGVHHPDLQRAIAAALEEARSLVERAKDSMVSAAG
ncbi:MAG: TlyA family rRNA (cytidine-2'-O)-methyltransferase [Chloroflexi bacterium]|nr:TlyA family rRNA (cytidine-2'-O)-methyltransferase [Chloroflexota bacterium]